MVGPAGFQESVTTIVNDRRAATPSKHPRGFDRKTHKGTADRLPISATLTY